MVYGMYCTCKSASNRILLFLNSLDWSDYGIAAGGYTVLQEHNLHFTDRNVLV